MIITYVISIYFVLALIITLFLVFFAKKVTHSWSKGRWLRFFLSSPYVIIEMLLVSIFKKKNHD